jgi:hypothetical protein
MVEKNSKESRLPQYLAPISAVWIPSFSTKYTEAGHTESDGYKQPSLE